MAAFDVISVEFPGLHLPVIKHFFQQKLFQICLKGLWHKLESCSEKHLSAFVFVLKFTPRQVLKNDIEKVKSIHQRSNIESSVILNACIFQIGPILLKCLTLTNIKSLMAALAIVLHFVIEQNEFFRDHLQSLIPQCLKLTTFTDSMVWNFIAFNLLNCQ